MYKLSVLSAILAMLFTNTNCDNVHSVSEGKSIVNEDFSHELTLHDILSIAINRKNYSVDLQRKNIVDTCAIPLIQRYRKIDSRFDSITKLYEEFDLKHYDSLMWSPILYAEELNMDADSDEELILIIGYKYSSPEVIFFDFVNQSYRMIGFEHIWLHNEYPKYEIINEEGINPIVKTSQFYNRGSGAWLKVNHYHRMLDSSMEVVFRSPSTGNMSLGFSGIFTQGNLLSDSFSMDSDQMMISYSIDAQVDKRFVLDTIKFDQIKVYENEIFNATYTWDSLNKYYLTDELDISKYLLNIWNDTCMFDLIQPMLKKMNTKVSRSYLIKYKDSNCEFY